MKVEIDMNDKLTIVSIEDDEEYVELHVGGNGVCRVKIDDLRTALRKMVAK